MSRSKDSNKGKRRKKIENRRKRSDLSRRASKGREEKVGSCLRSDIGKLRAEVGIRGRNGERYRGT
jgi:hypothetical protein